jgi:hypothetical protein
MSKQIIIDAIKKLAGDVDLDPQSRYEMLGEIGVVLEDETETLLQENDIDADDDFEDEDDDFEDDEDDEYDDFEDDDGRYDFDEEDEFDDEFI